MHLKFDGIRCTRTEADIDELLAAAESNYHRQGPEFDVTRLQGLFVKARKFNIQYDPDFIRTRIRSLKRVDPFFKDHADVLADSISAILSMIKNTELFPTPCKIAKLAHTR